MCIQGTMASHPLCRERGDVTIVLSPANWLQRRHQHQSRVRALLGPYLQLRAGGTPHPVIDFLFTYYRLTPTQLLRWHPGYGVTMAGQESSLYAHLRGYCRADNGVTVDPRHLIKRSMAIECVVRLLEATANRPASLNCFGLHEWAMIYRSSPDEVRHRGVPLRLGHNGTDAVVESLPLRCTHYDAFRFFASLARPRNAVQLTRETQIATEQPGCLHAGMDLYKFSAKLLPLLDSETLMDAFELAFLARELDMRASPYDLSAFGYNAVRIETPSGRAEYVQRQASLSERSAGVRAALLTRCRELLQCATDLTAAGQP